MKPVIYASVRHDALDKALWQSRGVIASTRTRIKICCMASREEVELAVGAGADAVGFVGTGSSSLRSLDDRTIAELTARVPPPVATFMLTAASTADGVARHVAATGASTVQLLFQLDPRESARLPTFLPATRRVQVIHVEGSGALQLIDRYAPHVHAFVLDSGRPNLPIPEYGGTGRTHDWAVSAEIVRRSPLPVFLAGGLSADNVAKAMQTVRPFGVDLCSGVRTDGRLDRDKLEAFIAAVRGADQGSSASLPS